MDTTIFAVTGYFDDNKEELFDVLMTDRPTSFPSLEYPQTAEKAQAYYDEDVYFYGVTAADIHNAITDGASLGELYPVAFAVYEEL
jgi:hypothetical protein